MWVHIYSHVRNFHQDLTTKHSSTCHLGVCVCVCVLGVFFARFDTLTPWGGYFGIHRSLCLSNRVSISLTRNVLPPFALTPIVIKSVCVLFDPSIGREWKKAHLVVRIWLPVGTQGQWLFRVESMLLVRSSWVNDTGQGCRPHNCWAGWWIFRRWIAGSTQHQVSDTYSGVLTTVIWRFSDFVCRPGVEPGPLEHTKFRTRDGELRNELLLVTLGPRLVTLQHGALRHKQGFSHKLDVHKRMTIRLELLIVNIHTNTHRATYHLYYSSRAVGVKVWKVYKHAKPFDSLSSCCCVCVLFKLLNTLSSSLSADDSMYVYAVVHIHTVASIERGSPWQLRW